MTIAEQAAQRVADGLNSTVEAAEWSITYQAGYANGRSDARNGAARDLTGATEGYRAGYTRSHQWTMQHEMEAGA
jgi:hypothetical protein